MVLFWLLLLFWLLIANLADMICYEDSPLQAALSSWLVIILLGDHHCGDHLHLGDHLAW